MHWAHKKRQENNIFHYFVEHLVKSERKYRFSRFSRLFVQSSQKTVQHSVIRYFSTMFRKKDWKNLDFSRFSGHHVHSKIVGKQRSGAFCTKSRKKVDCRTVNFNVFPEILHNFCILRKKKKNAFSKLSQQHFANKMRYVNSHFRYTMHDAQTTFFQFYVQRPEEMWGNSVFHVFRETFHNFRINRWKTAFLKLYG